MPIRSSIEQHNREIHQNKSAWGRKKVIREIYADFYSRIVHRLSPVEGLTVELGSGIGQAKEFVPQCITTDLFPNPWLDRVENAYALNFESGSVSNLILFDVWHHLQYPGTALGEFSRVLQASGRLLIFEPSMGILGRVALGLFHHEPLGLRDSIQWFAPVGFNAAAASYYAAQGNAWRVFAGSEYDKLLEEWRIVEVAYYPSFSYLASGGFRSPQLFPTRLLNMVRAIDRILEVSPKVFSSRMLVVLEKVNG